MTDTTRHPSARRAVWSSGDPTIAPSGGDFIRGSAWKGWDRSLAMAVLKGQQLRVLRLDVNGLAVETQWVRVTDRGRLRVAVMHPNNGLLYLATDSDPGAILRVRPS
jgi:glucose/arabinose dehydrogenase